MKFLTSTIRHLGNSALNILPPSRFFGLRRIILTVGGVVLSRNTSICGGGWIYGPGELTIGEDTWVSPGVTFYTNMSASINIEHNCDIGPEVVFLTGSHLIGDSHRRAGKGFAKSIRIGSGCWIGARSIILPGVTIGPGTVVAAGSVVTVDLAPHVLAAGVPARVKRILLT